MAHDLSDLSILLVEDSLHMRRIMRAIIRGLGVRTIHEAEDGARGFEMFQQHGPDVIVTDWIMPIMDGIEMTRVIRGQRDSINPYVPIIMMSGHGERRKVMTARDAGINEFLVKPVAPNDLYLRLAGCALKPRTFVKTKTFFGPDRRRFIHPQYAGELKRSGEHQQDEAIDDEAPDMARGVSLAPAPT